MFLNLELNNIYIYIYIYTYASHRFKGRETIPSVVQVLCPMVIQTNKKSRGNGHPIVRLLTCLLSSIK